MEGGGRWPQNDKCLYTFDPEILLLRALPRDPCKLVEECVYRALQGRVCDSKAKMLLSSYFIIY